MEQYTRVAWTTFGFGAEQCGHKHKTYESACECAFTFCATHKGPGRKVVEVVSDGYNDSLFLRDIVEGNILEYPHNPGAISWGAITFSWFQNKRKKRETFYFPNSD